MAKQYLKCSAKQKDGQYGPRLLIGVKVEIGRAHV